MKQLFYLKHILMPPYDFNFKNASVSFEISIASLVKLNNVQQEWCNQ